MLDDDVLTELRLIRGLLTAQLFQTLAQTETTPRDTIAALANAGLPPRAIAEVLGVTPNTISVTLTRLRKQRKVRQA